LGITGVVIDPNGIVFCFCFCFFEVGGVKKKESELIPSQVLSKFPGSKRGERKKGKKKEK
jgi:hypothetical protein